MTTLNIYNLLQECRVEKDVEEKYKRIISEHFPDGEINSPYSTDGVLKNGLTMLMEFKYNLDLTKRLQLVELLIQLIYYLKQFELHGEELPSIIFGGDINECFCLHSNTLLPYLNEDIDWSIAPSAAASKNPELAKKLYDDQTIIPYIFHINNDHFDFKFVVDKIKQLNEGTIQKVRITELNINRFFSYFGDKIIKQTKKYTPEELVSIFLNCLIDPANNYPHPRKKNSLVTNIAGDVSINGTFYDAFFEHFESAYSVDEKKRLTAICDRLIADEARRFHGEFYTPTEWVLEAHKMIEDTFGPNWKEEYVVWDPAWGTGNLTRDFKFKELYCSTLNYGDLQVAQHYNPEAVKFQYDFLNDDVTPSGLLPVDKIKLPRGLIEAFEKKKPIIIFMNPPYRKSVGGDGVFGNATDKHDINMINSIMVNKKMGKPSNQMYSQFLYRLMLIKKQYKLENISVCVFTPPLLLTGTSYKIFRKEFFDHFHFNKGMLIRASNFSDVSSEWAISFTIFNCNKNILQNDFVYDIKEKNEEEIIKSIIKKIIYNSDANIPSSIWVRDKIKHLSTSDEPKLKSALKVVENTQNSRRINNSIGSMYNLANNAYYNPIGVSLFSTSHSQSQNAFPVNDINYMETVSLFTARKTVYPNWINQKDEYLAPNEQHPEYPQWNTDAIIYSLFNGSSNQSALRQITYKDRLWDIKNEWFWMSNEQMLQLANENGFDELYHDAQGDHDRFVFNKIQESSFSQDAVDVYNKACELVVKTFPYREQLHEEHPEWHLHTWDAGWYQIKLVLKKYFVDDLKEFNVLYRAFEDRMREGVYKFGFLK